MIKIRAEVLNRHFSKEDIQQVHGQQVHEQMFNVLNHQGNQNHCEISPQTYQNDYHQKEKITVSKDMDYWSLYTIVGNVD